MITTEVKKKILSALKERRINFGNTDRGFATSIGINPAQWSQISSGNFHQVLSDQKWISLARICELDVKGDSKWKTANTEVFTKITAQLKKCQQSSLSSIFVDEAGIGKTYAAKQYVRENKFAVYIDCSLVKTKQRLVRQIARAFGAEDTGKYSNVFEDLCTYISTCALNPLVILDEAGDLDTAAFLELKALWNATEGVCGWYMMGADGLKEKIRRSIEYKKVGYAEILSRYGKKYQRATPSGEDEREAFNMKQASMIIKANAPEGTDIQAILIKVQTEHETDRKKRITSLRRIVTEISKL